MLTEMVVTFKFLSTYAAEKSRLFSTLIFNVSEQSVLVGVDVRTILTIIFLLAIHI